MHCLHPIIIFYLLCSCCSFHLISVQRTTVNAWTMDVITLHSQKKLVCRQCSRSMRRCLSCSLVIRSPKHADIPAKNSGYNYFRCCCRCRARLSDSALTVQKEKRCTRSQLRRMRESNERETTSLFAWRNWLESADCGSGAQQTIALPVLPFICARARTRSQPILLPSAASKHCYFTVRPNNGGVSFFFSHRVFLRFTLRALCAMPFAVHTAHDQWPAAQIVNKTWCAEQKAVCATDMLHGLRCGNQLLVQLGLAHRVPRANFSFFSRTSLLTILAFGCGLKFSFKLLNLYGLALHIPPGIRIVFTLQRFSEYFSEFRRFKTTNGLLNSVTAAANALNTLHAESELAKIPPRTSSPLPMSALVDWMRLMHARSQSLRPPANTLDIRTEPCEEKGFKKPTRTAKIFS